MVKALLPDEILWRTKEAFSDGVSNTARSLFQIIQDKIRDDWDICEQLGGGIIDWDKVTPIPQKQWNRNTIDISLRTNIRTVEMLFHTFGCQNT